MPRLQKLEMVDEVRLESFVADFELDAPAAVSLPLLLAEAGLDALLVERLGLTEGAPDMDEWRALVAKIEKPEALERIESIVAAADP